MGCRQRSVGAKPALDDGLQLEICARANSACVSARLPLVVDRSTTLLRTASSCNGLIADGLHPRVDRWGAEFVQGAGHAHERIGVFGPRAEEAARLLQEGWALS